MKGSQVSPEVPAKDELLSKLARTEKLGFHSKDDLLDGGFGAIRAEGNRISISTPSATLVGKRMRAIARERTFIGVNDQLVVNRARENEDSGCGVDTIIGRRSFKRSIFP
jgi:hypothetical protein